MVQIDNLWIGFAAGYRRQIALKRGPGGVICLYDNLVTLKGKDCIIPLRYV